MKTILKEIRKTDDEHDCILLFGHNPDFTHLANQYTNNFIDNVPTSGMVSIIYQTDSWRDISFENGVLLFTDRPKNYK